MFILRTYLSLFVLSFFPLNSISQIDEQALGAWYMYFFSTQINEGPWGAQGDIQHRNWDILGDLEQLMLRGGLTYSPTDANIKLTLGYANITTGTYGSDDSTIGESRIYQEALFPTMIGSVIHLNHRFRFEQRFVDKQDFRTRYRYNLFMNIPITAKEFSANTVYLALYNELFINGQRNIGEGKTVQIFDRNRTYSALGYVIKSNLKLQVGVMRQVTENWSKDQLQVSLHHNF
ncbi:MAG: DUF2490 domain-containing protein [Flavobacteriales bacterium]|nr:DUF2490 domain-containing protein [Flavobacteriales bacterium]